MLKRSPVLIAEDEPIIALDLALAVQDADGEVVGPAATVKEALALLETRTVQGAILDVNLADRDISPVAVYLLNRGIPTILQTGMSIPPELAERFPDLVVRTKPNRADQLVMELASMIAKHGNPTYSA